MAAGYDSLTVTKSGSNVYWSFNATAVSSAYYFVRVECGGLTEDAEGLNNTASVLITGSAGRGPAGSRTYTVRQYVRGNYGQDWIEEGSAQVYVSWDADVFTVTFDPGAGSVSERTRSVAYGAAFGTLPVPAPPAGYGFEGWYDGDTPVTAETVCAGDVTVLAHYTPLAVLHLVRAGAPETVTDIRVVESGAPRRVLSVWSVTNGVPKQGV